MKKLPLFIDAKKNYHLVSKKCVCEDCSSELDNIFFLVSVWAKSFNYHKVLCNSCLLKVEKLGVVFEAKFGKVSRSVYSDFTPVFLSSPEFQNVKKLDVFAAANLDSVKTVDKTVYAGRESLEGSKIGLDKSLIEEKKLKDLLLLENEVLKNGRK